MATKTKVDAELLERTALEIYKGYMLGGAVGYTRERLAEMAFERAYPFAAMAQRVRAEEVSLEKVIEPDDGLDYASAPNLPYGGKEWDQFNKNTKRFGKSGRENYVAPATSDN